MPDDERLREWIEELENKDDPGNIEQRLDRDYEDVDFESQEYRQYKSEERSASEKIWYERLVDRTSFFSYTFDDMKEQQQQALRLLDWDIDVDQIGPSALVVALLVSPISIVFAMTSWPGIFKLFFLMLPFVAFYYMLKYPALQAKRKVVQSSEDLILSILYMVVYMRSTPNLEGAVSFAAKHLSGPVSNDFNEILWELDMRVYESIEVGISEYMERWKPYNRGFVESLGLLQSAITAPTDEKRQEILGESVSNLLESTRSQMDDFARQMKMPVMILHGLGILLPILGVMLFPMVAVFMGSQNMVYYLFFLYDILIPLVVLAIMRNLLLGRPVSFSSASGQLGGDERGKIIIDVMGKELTFKLWWFTGLLFLIMAIIPAQYYLNILFGPGQIADSPGAVRLLQELSFLLAIALPVGIHFVLKNGQAIERQNQISEMEEEFTEILFELGNQLDKGVPMERAVDQVAEKRKSLSISDMFRLIGENIRKRGMTFRQAVFAPKVGAASVYNSQLIATIMEVIAEAIRKGPKVTADSALSISNYLKNIHETQERLEELLEDSISSLQFLAYIMAPIIAGIAVGMGGVIAQAFTAIGATFDEANISNGTGTGGAGGGELGGGGIGGGAPGGILEVFGFESSIPPGILAVIVGIYIIQLSFIVGSLIVRLKYGNNGPKREYTIGRILIISSISFTIVVLIINVVFGGIIGGVGG